MIERSMIDPDEQAWDALRQLQRAVRAYALGLGSEQLMWERIMECERTARALITETDTARVGRGKPL